ncbi:hypothetical protein [Variovorax sp. GT1P44]|uniref:hypothetical protein n=1 Tax=Variovorax sp. GT1P44 TaxID=3443742 RepID=UPI003F47815C
MNANSSANGSASEAGSSIGISTVHADRFERQGNESTGQTCTGRVSHAGAAPTEWDEWKSVRDLA